MKTPIQVSIFIQNPLSLNWPFTLFKFVDLSISHVFFELEFIDRVFDSYYVPIVFQKTATKKREEIDENAR